MLRHQLQRRVAVLTLCVAAVGLVSPAVPAGQAASLSGRVLEADGLTPRAGVSVVLVDKAAGRVFRSSITNPAGGFVIGESESGRYDLLVETEAGAYMLAEPLEVAAGANAPIAIRLPAPGTASERTLYQAGNPDDTLSPVVKWIIVGFIGAAAIFVIDELGSEDDETQSSGF